MSGSEGVDGGVASGTGKWCVINAEVAEMQRKTLKILCHLRLIYI